MNQIPETGLRLYLMSGLVFLIKHISE